MTRTIPDSELLLNTDGSIFHLHLLSDQVADRIILVGDPGRVPLVASRFDRVECEAENREFHTATGYFRGKRVSCVSTGIGCGNIDIVMTELDALHNIDLKSRRAKERIRPLRFVRIGTCGALQESNPTGSFVASEISVGLDTILNHYAGSREVCDAEMAEAFARHMQWEPGPTVPYAVHASAELLDDIAGRGGAISRGITVTSPGFYAPQGRYLRLAPADLRMEEKIRTFEFHGLRTLNFEMESSAVAGLAALLGHQAVTVCLVIANRYAKSANTDYKEAFPALIDVVLSGI